RETGPERAQIVISLHAQQPGVQRGNGEKKARAIFFDYPKNLFRLRSLGPKDCGGAKAEGKIERVPETVGEEELRGGEADIIFLHSQNGFYKEIRDRDHIVLQVNCSFGRAGASGGIAPPGDVVLAGRFRLQAGGGLRSENFKGDSPAPRLSDDQHAFKL